MSGFLRYIGLINAAIWFGGSLFFSFGVAPAVFSDDMRQLFPQQSSLYFAGAIAMVILRRYFILQYVCGGAALLHLLAERFYSGRASPRITAGIVIAALALGLLGGLWLQPHMSSLRNAKYSVTATPAQRESAGRAFGIWHGVSQSVNILVIAGVLVYLIRMARPTESRRSGLFYQIR